MDEYLKRTWAEIDLDAAAHNYRVIRAAMKPGVKLCCVVKADAYGHGAEQLARLYEEAGADWLAVSNLEEAVQLRSAGACLPILILGYTPPKMAGRLCAMNIAQAILDERYAVALNAEARRQGTTVRCHIKLDTGMSRIGFVYQDPQRDASALDAVERICALPGLVPEGLFTHFAVADEGGEGAAFTRRQFNCFQTGVEALKARGILFQILHCDNSAALADYEETQLDMCRPGILLYGMQPSGSLTHPLPLKPVMAVKSVISQVKVLEEGTPVSYGCTYKTTGKTVAATVPTGYADGYPRLLSNKGTVLVHGVRAPILGRVCMDQMVVDVSAIPGVREGDEVTLIGRDGEEEVTAAELAGLIGTINYELTCGINKRVPRVFLREGKLLSVKNLLV